MRTLIAWIEGRRVGAFTESPRPDGSIHYAFDYETVTSDIVWIMIRQTKFHISRVTRTLLGVDATSFIES